MARARSRVMAEDGELIVERDPERVSGRLLRQADMDASYVDLADAAHLEFDYMRWMRLVLRAHRARHVLHVGGAACALPRALLAEDASSRQEVFEVDQRVVEIARAHMGLRRQRGLRVRVAEGRAALEDRLPGGSEGDPCGEARRSDRAEGGAGRGADAIVIDAFIGARVPRHLVTREALAVCARIAPLTIVNVVDTAGRGDARSIASGLGASYSHVAALCSGTRRAGNVIVFGAAQPPPLRQLEGAAAADPSPARLLRAEDLTGAAAWSD